MYCRVRTMDGCLICGDSAMTAPVMLSCGHCFCWPCMKVIHRGLWILNWIWSTIKDHTAAHEESGRLCSTCRQAYENMRPIFNIPGEDKNQIYDLWQPLLFILFRKCWNVWGGVSNIWSQTYWYDIFSYDPKILLKCLPGVLTPEPVVIVTPPSSPPPTPPPRRSARRRTGNRSRFFDYGTTPFASTCKSKLILICSVGKQDKEEQE